MRARGGIVAAQLSALILAAPLGAEQGPPADWDTPTLYQRACAPCHGADGSGLTPEAPNYSNFETLPADFTDPLFNSREPAEDWYLVIAHGGVRLGLSSQMPAYSSLDEKQMRDLVAYLKGMADTRRYPPGELNFLRPVETIKAFPEDEALLIQRYESGSRGEPDALRTTLYYARRFGARYQGEIKLSHLEPDRGPDRDDLELGFKWALRDNLERSSLLSLGLEAEIPLESGRSEELIPYFSFAKGLSDAFTLQGTLRAKLPTDDPDRGEAAFSAVVHWMRSPWPRGVFPAFEWTVAEPLSGGGETASTLLPQLYFGLSKGGHVALTLGFEIPLTGLDYDYRLHGFLLWDVADGPFWSGW